jgi:hypothetical protein
MTQPRMLSNMKLLDDSGRLLRERSPVGVIDTTSAQHAPLFFPRRMRADTTQRHMSNHIPRVQTTWVPSGETRWKILREKSPGTWPGLFCAAAPSGFEPPLPP